MKAIVTGVIAVLLLGTGGWCGYQYAVEASDARYEALTKGAAVALDKGDTHAGARLAIAATTGRSLLRLDTARAEGLLLEAVMKDQPILSVTETKAFPKYATQSDSIPENYRLGSDGTRLMLLQNDGNSDAQNVIDIYELPSGRLLRRFDLSVTHPFWFSNDLKSVAIWNEKASHFEDVVTGKVILGGFTLAPEFDVMALSRDHKRILTREYKKDFVRAWNLGATPAQTRDFPSLGESSFYGTASPDARTLALETDGFDTRVFDAESGAVRFNIDSNGRVTLAFSPDGRYLAVSRHVGDGHDGIHGWQYGVTLRDLRTSKTIMAETVADEVSSILADDGRLLPIQTDMALRLFDIRTKRFTGAPSYDLGGFDHSMARRGSTVYSIGMKHDLRTAKLDPLLNASLGGLLSAACTKWHTPRALRIRPEEMKAHGLKLGPDPCD